MLSRFIEELELFKRHVYLLTVVKKNQPIGILKISEITKIPPHKVRYSLRILQQENLIEPTNRGAVVTKKGDEFLSKLGKYLSEIEKYLREIKKVAKV